MIAIGGSTRPVRGAVREAGAWGVAAIARALARARPGSGGARPPRALGGRHVSELRRHHQRRGPPGAGPGHAARAPAHLGLDPRTVVVEHNREIVRRPRLGETMLADGRPDRAGALRRRGVSRGDYLSATLTHLGVT